MNEISRTMAPGHAPPAGMTWADFLRPLLFSVAQPPGRDVFDAKVRAIAVALPEITATMRTPVRQRDLMRACTHWPTPPEVLRIFADDLAHTRDMAAIRQERAQALPPPAPAARTPEEIEAVRAKAKAFAAAMGATGDTPTREVKPAYLSGEALARARAAARIKL